MVGYGVKFGSKHSLTDFGLVLSNTKVTPPSPKFELIDVPGSDIQIDLTEVLNNDVNFNNGEITFTFTILDDYRLWPSKYTQILNYLHGRRMKIVRDIDSNFYYMGRCEVTDFEASKKPSSIVIRCNVEPWKYDIQSDSGQWEWGPFSFVDGIIYVNKIEVVKSRTLVLVSRRQTVVPVFNCSAAMSLDFKGKTYQLKPGNNRLLSIQLVEGRNLLDFTGSGTVEIFYTGGTF